MFLSPLKLLSRMTSTGFMVIYTSYSLVELIPLDLLRLFVKLLKRNIEKVKETEREQDRERDNTYAHNWGPYFCIHCV